jgi:hypothetical protein
LQISRKKTGKLLNKCFWKVKSKREEGKEKILGREIVLSLYAMVKGVVAAHGTHCPNSTCVKTALFIVKAG